MFLTHNFYIYLLPLTLGHSTLQIPPVFLQVKYAQNLLLFYLNLKKCAPILILPYLSKYDQQNSSESLIIISLPLVCMFPAQARLIH